MPGPSRFGSADSAFRPPPRPGTLLIFVRHRQVDALPVADQRNRQQRDPRHDQQVQRHRDGAPCRLQQALSDRRGKRTTEDGSQSVGDGHPAEPDRGREELDVQSSLRAVGQPQPDREDAQCQIQQAEVAGVDELEQREGSDDQDDESDDVGLHSPDANGQHSRSRGGDQPDE